MDTELLRTFLQVAKTGRFRLAAEQLCLTQSAVSARIKLLEGEMGVRLFERNKHGVALTDAGNRLVSHAETILSDWQRCRQEVILPSDTGAVLAVGSVDSVWTMYLGKWLALTRQETPELAIKAEISSSDVLVRQLLDGSLDLIVVFETPQLPQVISVPLATIPMVMVANRRKQTVEQAMAGQYIFVDWSPVFSTLHLQHFPGFYPSQTAVDLFQKIQAPAEQSFIRDSQTGGFPGAGRAKNGVVSFPQIVQSDVLADINPELELHPAVFNSLNLFADHVLGQSVRRNAVCENASGFFSGFKNGHPVTEFPEVIGGGKTCRPGSYDGHPLSVFLPGSLIQAIGVIECVISDETFNRPYREGFVQFSPVAILFADMRADPAGDGGHWIGA